MQKLLSCDLSHLEQHAVMSQKGVKPHDEHFHRRNV